MAHPLAVLPLQVEVVGGVHASVHPLLVPGDAALHPDPLGRRAQGELLQVVYIHAGFSGRGGGDGRRLLQHQTNQRPEYSPPSQASALTLSPNPQP